MKRFAIAVLMLMVAVPTLADSIDYTILGPNTDFGPATFLSDCTFPYLGDYVITATLTLTSPANELRMSQPNMCAGSVTWNYPVSGDPAGVLTVDLGGCTSGQFTLFTANLTVSSSSCCPSLVSGPIIDGPRQDSPPVLVGCDATERFVVPPCSPAPPTPSVPANGATVYSATPTLAWTFPTASGDYCFNGIGVATFTVDYGTDPSNLDRHAVFTPEAMSGMLPALEPFTTFYWRVQVIDEYGEYSGSHANVSPLFSFTTSAPVPTREATWGAIKALYSQPKR